ncbi:hypothetical protein ACIBL6_14235 [Streptomyces sp. NPDC050400]|uniref:hypothetical protein n=1 Tax=Streptomyces sp. NPDC050400 TaxID=3365610 RepID=UPI0037A42516
MSEHTGLPTSRRQRRARAFLTFAAALSIGGIVCLSAAAADVTVVNPGDLGPSGPWFRLQDDPGNAGIPNGTQEVAPFADAQWLDGSLHLGIGGGETSQAAHAFPAPITLTSLLASSISYSAYLDSAGSTAGNTSANLQFPMICGGAFTTLSFEPGRNTDTAGRTGVVPDTWQAYAPAGTSSWRTSRAVAGIPAQGDATLATFAAACTDPGDGALGVIARVGRLGSDTATLDTYVDGITVAGTTYNFAVEGRATAAVKVADRVTAGGPPVNGSVTYTNPADGPAYPDTGTALTLKGPAGLRADQVTLTVAGRRIPLTAGPGGTLVATLPKGTVLNPSGTSTTAFTLAVADGAPTGPLAVSAELTAEANGGSRKPVDVENTASLRIEALPSPSPNPSTTPPKGEPSAGTAPAPAPPAPSPTGPTLAETGAGAHKQWLGIGAASLIALGSAVLFFARRRAN